MKISRSDLPEDLIGEILLRLPVKAVLRFKCVCKEWCGLIGSRSFINGHYSHASNPNCQIIELISLREPGSEFSVCGDDGSHFRSEASDYISKKPMRDPFRQRALLGPANGIFCVVAQDLRRIALLNPATRKLKPLPPIPLHDWGYLNFGFGIDPSSRDYKVVVFDRTYSNPQRYFCVYTSSSDSWRKEEVEGWMYSRFQAPYRSCKHGLLLLDGVLHWIERKCILAFDMRREKFHEILAPDAVTVETPRSCLYMTAYGDSLALLSYPFDNENRQNVDLWVMGRDGLWTKHSSIQLPQGHIMWPISLWNRNKNKLLLHNNYYGEAQIGALFLWDLSTQKLLKIGPEFDYISVNSIFSYKESLVSFKGGTCSADCVDDVFDKLPGWWDD